MKRRTQSKPTETVSRTTVVSDLTLTNGNIKDDTKMEQNEKHKQRILKEIKIQRIRDTVKKLQSETLYHVNEQLSSLMDSITGELERLDTDTEDTLFNGKGESDERDQRGEKGLGKRFLARASPLSELMEVRHIRSLHHLFVAALILALVCGAVGDALEGGWNTVRIGIRYIPPAFAGFDRALLLWLVMFFVSCLIHPLFTFWYHLHSKISSHRFRWFYDRCCIILLIVILGVFNRWVIKTMGIMAPASSAFLLLEQCRFLMKSHAFVRTNVPRTPYIPSFSLYLYFLFAPTLIYRDSYPRTSHIRWNYVLERLVEFIGAILMLSCIMELHGIPEYADFGLKKQTKSSLSAIISRSILPGSIFTLCGFYLFLQSWSNAWAEVLKFADRRFYGDWWNATSYSDFYRTWNTVVHDYLHTYIFKDVRASTGSSILGKLSVFAVSAIVHEYIMAVMLGFCYPVMFVQFFGVGTVLSFVRSTAGAGRTANIFFWVTMATGLGLQYSLYTMEAFARRNCPRLDESWKDFFVPRSWSCNGLDL